MINLSKESCVACRKDSPRLNPEEISNLCREIPDWDFMRKNNIPILTRSFRFADFDKAIHFVDKIALLSELEDHHPKIIVEWRKVTIQWWTHIIGGLHRNDFVMASKTGNLYK